MGEGDSVIVDYSEGESKFKDQFAYVNSCVSGTQLQQNQLRKPWKIWSVIMQDSIFFSLRTLCVQILLGKESIVAKS